MFQSLSRNYKLLTTLVILLALAAIAVLGPGHFLGMKVKSDGTMSGCVFSGKAALCSMGIMEHLARWQNLFTAIPAKTILALGIAILLVLVLRQQPASLLNEQTDLQKPLSDINNNASVLNPLRMAFARGLLHPKVYNS